MYAVSALASAASPSATCLALAAAWVVWVLQFQPLIGRAPDLGGQLVQLLYLTGCVRQQLDQGAGLFIRVAPQEGGHKTPGAQPTTKNQHTRLLPRERAVAEYQQNGGQPQENGVGHNEGPQRQRRFRIAHVRPTVVSISRNVNSKRAGRFPLLISFFGLQSALKCRCNGRQRNHPRN